MASDSPEPLSTARDCLPMCQHFVRGLSVLVPALVFMTSGWLAAADLPIVRVIIGPDGAVVEHAGTLPPGDAVVSGLPLGIDPAQLAVTIDGLATPPALNLRLPVPPDLPPAPAEWLARNRAATRAFEAVQARLELATLREELARTVRTTSTELQAAAAVLPAGFPSLGLPTPAAQQALLAFVERNTAQARDERTAALRDREQARAQLIALDEEREAARPRLRLQAELPLPGAEGRAVRLRYSVDRARWAPQYRLEVDGAKAVLVREALVDVPTDVNWRQGRLELVTRMPERDLVLNDLTVPVLSLGDEALQGEVGERRRLLARGGGMRASSSTVDASLRQAKRSQSPDGSWGGGSARVQATALRLLMFMGAGYDHRTPNKYRLSVAKGIEWLSTQVGQCRDLSSQALALFALAEATALTADEPLKIITHNAVERLRERAFTRGELEIALYRKGPMVGPEALAWTAMAFKSAATAGVEIDDALIRCRDLGSELIGHGDRAEAQITRLLLSVYLSGSDRRADAPFPFEEWLDAMPQWLSSGRPELVYFANLALFQVGGDSWARWSDPVRTRLLELLDSTVDRGGLIRLVPHPFGEDIAEALCALPVQVYYRYNAVSTVDAGALRLQRPHLPNVVTAANGWPLRYDAGLAQLSQGQLQRLVLDRLPLPGGVSLHAAPIDGPGAWRVLTSTNPLATPLIAGPLQVVVDGERLGEMQLAFITPKALLSLPLGRDDRVQITRSEQHRDVEAWGKRTRTVTIRFRVEAPKALHPLIRIDEPMPRPADPAIHLVATTPAITVADLDRRLVEDAVWHLDLPLAAGSATGEIVYDLRFPATIRPQIHTGNPAPAASADSAITPSTVTPSSTAPSSSDKP